MLSAAALLHPSVSPHAIRPFHQVFPDIRTICNLEDASQKFAAALIFGGDGTVHRHLPQLHQRKIPALIVPKGSGNDFAKSLGMADAKTALAAWKQFCAGANNVQEIDLGILRHGAGEALFCCVAGMGLDSEANCIANAMPAWLRGSAGYVLAALRAIAGFEPTEFRVQADSGQPASRQIAKPGLFVAVGNAGSYGGGARITPNAQLDDGLLDVCFVAEMSKLRTLLCFPTVFLGRHLGIKQVEYFQARTVRVESGRPLEVYADGEPVCQTPVEISLLPRALKVIVPG